MYNNNLIATLIIILIILGVILIMFKSYKLFIKKGFWSRQPIMKIRDMYIKNKIITDKFDNTEFLKLQPNDSIEYVNVISDGITEFINNNFYSGAKFIDKYLKWYLSNKIIKTSNFIIKNLSNIIGFISGIHINFTLYNKIFEGYYIDFLCIHKKFRNKSYATKLISKLTHNANEYNNKKVHIFKIDNRSLPDIKIFTEVKYYLIDLDKIFIQKSLKIKNDIEIRELNKNDMSELYDYYNRYKKKFKIYQNYSFKEFIYKFQSYFFSKSYVIIKNSKIICFINLIIFIKNNVKMAEIAYLFCEYDKIDLTDLLILLTKIYSDTKIRKVYITNISDNKVIINYLLKKNFIKDLNIHTYFYLYNYIFERRLNSNEILF